MRIVTVLCTLLAVATVALADTPPPVPSTPATVEEVVYARSFTLHEGYTFEWQKEQPELTRGTILVLKVDPAFVVPRQTLEPVLYVGDQTAERINRGLKSKHLVVVVPGDVDLEKTPIWFGTPGLPEQVDANRVKAERTAATNAGIKPFDGKKAAAARKNGGDALNVADRYELGRRLAELIRTYSPQESELADSLLVPRIERKKTKAND